MSLPLPLRSRLAELCLEALDQKEARRAVTCLVAFCRSAQVRQSREVPWGSLVDMKQRLGGERISELPAPLAGLLEERRALVGERTVHLAQRWATFLAEITDRAEAYWLVVGTRIPPTLMGRAVALFNAGCYFEVHELLEPAWMEATDQGKVALQGLIQVAVGFHHLRSKNRDGARLLLAEGIDKLRVSKGEGLGLDLSQWLRELTRCLAQIESGEPFDWHRVPPLRLPVHA